jgi:hypothetical protein
MAGQRAATCATACYDSELEHMDRRFENTWILHRANIHWPARVPRIQLQAGQGWGVPEEQKYHDEFGPHFGLSYPLWVLSYPVVAPLKAFPLRQRSGLCKGSKAQGGSTSTAPPAIAEIGRSRRRPRVWASRLAPCSARKAALLLVVGFLSQIDHNAVETMRNGDGQIYDRAQRGPIGL